MTALKTYLDTLGEQKRPRVFPEVPFAHGVSALVEVHGLLGFSGHRELAVLDVDLDALFRDSGEFERRSDKILVYILMQVKSTM